MTQPFKSIISRTFDLGLIGVLVLGLSIAAIRLAAPFADRFRPELEAWLAESLGTEVRIGRLELRLVGLVPRLGLRDTVLLNPENGQLQLRLAQIWIDPDPGASLMAWAPRIRSVTLVGARLAIERGRNGDIRVAGLEGMTGDDPEALGFFLGHGRLQLVDSQLSWSDEQTGAPPLHLSGVRVRLENRGERHRIGIFARRLDERQIRLRLVGDLHGGPLTPADWSGALYLQWEGDDLGRLLAGWLPADLRLESQAVTLESWNLLEAGRLDRSLNRIGITDLRVAAASGTRDGLPPLDWEEVTGLLRWQRVDGGWRLEARDLTLTRDGTHSPVSDWGVRFAAGDDGGWTLAGGGQGLDLAAARDLLARLPWVPPQVRDPLGAIRLGGGLDDLRFRFEHRPRLPLRWAASARVEDLSLDAHGRLSGKPPGRPLGIRGLTAALAASQRGGRLVLPGGDLELDLPHLFPHPLGLDTVAGELRWRRESDGAVQVGAQALTAGNAHIATRSRFSVLLPADGGSPFLDLHTQFRVPQIARIPDHLPTEILTKDLTVWLEHALVAGRIPQGDLLFSGVIADFPFDEQQGRFQVLFPIRDCTLEFSPYWPPLKKLSGEARFENRGVTLSFAQGRLLDSDLSRLLARIPDLDQAVTVEVRGRVEGPFADDIRILAESPLRRRFGALAELLGPKGKARLDLDMTIPLYFDEDEDLLRLAGELGWPEPAALTIADQDLELTGLTGKLRFTELELETPSIEARLWGVPVRLRVKTRRAEPKSGKKAGAITRIRATGRFPVPVLARQFPSPVWDSLQGQARLELNLDIAGANLGEDVPPLDFELTSDLTGLALALPAPLGKPAAASRRLRLSGRLAPEEPLGIRGAYGNLGIALGLDREDEGGYRLTRGALHLAPDRGDPAPALPAHAGFHVSGSLASLDLRPWFAWWADHQPPAKGGPVGKATPLSARLYIGHLRLAPTALDRVRFELAHQDRHWQAKIDARELAGRITVPHHPRAEPVRIRLSRLDIKGLFARRQAQRGAQPTLPGHAHKNSQAPTGKHPTDPRQAHTLELDIERLQWGRRRLGRLALRSRTTPHGLKFPRISLTGPHMTIKGWGGWRWTGAGPRSNLSLTAYGQDLGGLLRSLEFTGLRHRTPARFELDLAWPGAPLQLAAAKLQGQVRIDLGGGYLQEIEPGAGRVLGLFNLHALQRRLVLDFDDLFARGYAFEKLSGRIHIERGRATIGNLRVTGPAADIGIVGSANLVRKEFDQILTITPHIGASLAIAGAVVGEPLVGIAALLADQASVRLIDKLGRHQYHLSGPWAEPLIRRGGLVK